MGHKFFYLTLFILCCAFANKSMAQNECAEISSKTEWLVKKYEKHRRLKIEDIQLYFDIANCKRNAGDTNFKQWYIMYTEQIERFSNRKKNEELWSTTLERMAKSFLYLKDYKQGEVWIKKYLSTNPSPVDEEIVKFMFDQHFGNIE